MLFHCHPCDTDIPGSDLLPHIAQQHPDAYPEHWPDGTPVPPPRKATG